MGEYQNSIFFEAARVLKLKHPNDVLFVLVSYLPIPNKIGEMKTKPTQYAVRAINSYGIHPDIIIARSDRPLDQKRKDKLAFSCNVPAKNIISAPDVDNIYDIPLNFEKDSLSTTVLRLLRLRPRQEDLKDWREMVERMKISTKELRIGVVGKYFKTGDYILSDVYISIIESLKHAAGALGRKLILDWLDAGDYEDKKTDKLAELKNYDGLLVPGGFGERGVDGKIEVIKFAREKEIPFFGLCYGMQLAVVEYARHVAGLKRAHTTEINSKTPVPVIDVLPEQRAKIAQADYGGTMRLGAYPAKLLAGSIAETAYLSTEALAKADGGAEISERHRHRYEVNPDYVEILEKAGLIFSGRSPDGRLMEIIELPKTKHPFFLGTQFHPEFKSTPLHPHPLFVAFLQAAGAKK